MKLPFFLLLIFGTLLLSSCADKDSAAQYPAPSVSTNSISGVWQLRFVTGGFAGIKDSFAAGEILWTFDTVNQTVCVLNNNTNPDKVDLYDTGIYTYAFVSNTVAPQLCAMNLEVDSVNWGCYHITSTQMQVSMTEADGYILNFER